MKLKTFAFASMFALAGLVVIPAHAGVIVYNNDFGGVISGDNYTEDAWNIESGSYSVVDSFSLGSSTSLSSIELALWLYSGDTLSSLSWAILDDSDPSDPFDGNVLYSGTGVVPTSSFIETNADEYDIYSETFDVTTGTLTAGTTYWLEIFGATTTEGNPVYWDQSDGPSTGYQLPSGGSPYELPNGDACMGGCTGSESFELSSGVSTTPEPGTLALLGGGLIGLAALRRRKS